MGEIADYYSWGGGAPDPDDVVNDMKPSSPETTTTAVRAAQSKKQEGE